MEDCVIMIYSGGKLQIPPVIGGITWKTARKGEAGELTFTCIKTEGLSFSEGAEVYFHYGKTKVFHGYVVKKHRNKNHHIEVTCYDQLFYLKNKNTYVWTNVRADQVVSRIANDFQLQVGTLPNTKYVIPRFEKDNQSLFDMILDSLDETVHMTNNLYYLYDDFGKIMLKNIKDSILDLLIYNESAADFDYTTSIDGETYNNVAIYGSDESQATLLAHEKDMKNIGQWGVLRYVDTVQNGGDPKARAKAIMTLYNRVQRSLTINGHKGDIRVRAGCSVFIDLNLGDMIAKQLMLVDSVTHTFDYDHHTMELELIGCKDFYD